VGLYLISAITFNVVERKKARGRKSYFRQLNKDAFEKWGANWGEPHRFIKNITLYQRPMEHPSTANYILYFNIDSRTKDGKLFRKTFHNAYCESSLHMDVFLNYDVAKEVYKEDPPENFQDEWEYTTEKYKGEFNEKFSWVIYKK
jgi:hypothetical protein